MSKFTKRTYIVNDRELSYKATWNLLTDSGCDNVPLYGNYGLEGVWVDGCGNEIDVSFWDEIVTSDEDRVYI